MSYAEDFNHDLDPEFMGLSLYGSDYDLDSEIEESAEFMSSEDTDWDSAWMHYTPETLWECKDGTIIAIEDMKTSHIKNCIAMIEKSINANKPWRTEYLSTLKAELASRIP